MLDFTYHHCNKEARLQFQKLCGKPGKSLSAFKEGLWQTIRGFARAYAYSTIAHANHVILDKGEHHCCQRIVVQTKPAR
jgi:hypothetical protein